MSSIRILVLTLLLQLLLGPQLSGVSLAAEETGKPNSEKLTEKEKLAKDRYWSLRRACYEGEPEITIEEAASRCDRSPYFRKFFRSYVEGLESLDEDEEREDRLSNLQIPLRRDTAEYLLWDIIAIEVDLQLAKARGKLAAAGDVGEEEMAELSNAVKELGGVHKIAKRYALRAKQVRMGKRSFGNLETSVSSALAELREDEFKLLLRMMSTEPTKQVQDSVFPKGVDNWTDYWCHYHVNGKYNSLLKIYELLEYRASEEVEMLERTLNNAIERLQRIRGAKQKLDVI